MAFTPEQLAKIAQKEASLPDALKRNTMTNYREGYFFITLKTRNYAPILSTIAGLPDANDGEPNAPRCIYTKLGRKVMEVWQTAPQQPATTTQQQPHPTPPKPLLSYIGSYALLAAERKLPLICHRSDAPFFDRQRDAVLNAAKSGAVIVSAFISPREREIMKLLLMEQLPVIEVVDNGFADRYKPTGKRFYACAENRLVQISPWTYEYQRDNMVTREMCLVMNQLVRVIAGRGEEWWKGK